MFVKWFFMFLALIACHVESAKILGVFPHPSKSHSILGQALFMALAKQGHEVTFINPFPMKNPPNNYRDLPLTDKRIVEVFQAEMDNSFEANEQSPLFVLKDWFKDCALMNEYTLKDPAVQKLLNSKTEKFDLIIIDLLANEALLGFGAHFNAPIIGMSTFGQVKYVNHMMHSPAPMSMIPHPFLSFTDRMTYSERLQNVLFNTLEDVMAYFFHFPLQRQIYDASFPDPKPCLNTLKKDVSLVLLNSHFTLNYPRPYVPNMIEVGGMHINQKKPLPKNIQDYLDSADEGVVYFSMGSIIQATDWPVQKREAFVEAFGKLKQKVLWKYENETLPGNPGNIMIGSWLPQRDILAHPNVKVFITHGGLLGTTEAVVEGVPVIGIPIYGDQQLNIQKAAAAGYGVVLDFNTITEESITNSLNEVLNNPSIASTAKALSKRYSDRPMTPQQTAVYWTEYVIRHQGASHLKSTALDLSFIQLHLIDVYAVIIAILISLLMLWGFLIKLTIKKLFYKKKSNRKIKKK
ncbi:unnamed protein product [Diamesa tonsa]